MTATTRSTECSAPGTTLMLAFELGSTKWTLEFHDGPGAAPAPCGRGAPGTALAGELERAWGGRWTSWRSAAHAPLLASTGTDTVHASLFT